MKHLIIALILTGSIAVLNTPIAEAITGTTNEVMPESSQGAATQEVLDEAALDGPKAGVDESGNVEGEVTNIFTEADTDGDGIPDSQDPDADGDGVPNADDYYPYNSELHENPDPFNPTTDDSDGDGILDIHDPYVHNDSHPDDVTGTSEVTTTYTPPGGAFVEGLHTVITTHFSDGTIQVTTIEPDGSSITVIMDEDYDAQLAVVRDAEGNVIHNIPM